MVPGVVVGKGTPQSTRILPLRSWVRLSPRTHDIHVKRVIQHSTESRGFPPGIPVSSPHREVNGVGWD